jgi:starch synthase
MGQKKILFITQEMKPYTDLSFISEIARVLPEKAQGNDYEVRILMPRFGTINERRHRLHEVVRLSGMNIIVNDEDYPLIIKVASLPGARMQVYFLDNEEFFKRKRIFTDSDDNAFEDNPERMIFFCRGVLETLKKFGWPPDLIHLHGWMTSLIPSYMKHAYKAEPLFKKSKLIYSAYDVQPPAAFDEDFLEKAMIHNLDEENLDSFKQDGKIDFHLGALTDSDALILGSEDIDDAVKEEAESKDLPILEYQDGDEFVNAHADFYDSLIDEEEDEDEEES